MPLSTDTETPETHNTETDARDLQRSTGAGDWVVVMTEVTEERKEG